MNPLEQVKKALDEAIAQKKISQEMLKNLGPAIIETLQPVLAEIAENSKISREEILDALSQLKINIPDIDVPHATVEVKIPDIIVPEPKVTVNVPEIKLPEFPPFPEIKVPKAEVKVNVPTIKLPPFVWPKEDMPIRGWAELMGLFKDTSNPISVQLRDAEGNPIKLFENLTQIVGGGGGGKSDHFTIKGFGASAYSELTNADGRLRVSVETGGSGLTDNELRASAVPVSQASGAIWSTAVTEIFGSTITSSVLNADNRLRVSLETGGSGLTDAELRASSVPVEQVSGSIWSTYVTGAAASTYAELLNPDGRVKVELPTGSSGLTDNELRASSVPVSQVSGSIWSTYVTGALNSLLVGYESGDSRIKVELPTGSSGLTDTELRASAVPVSQVSGVSWSTEATQAGTWNIGTVTTVTGVTNSISASIVDSSGVQYSGSNPVPITGSVSVTGSVSSTGAYLLNGDGTYRDTMPISGSVSVSGSITSTVVTGTVVSDAVDDGSAPVKTGGIARTDNPTAVAGGDTVSASYDDLGRQLMRTQARDLISTAYVSVTNGTETTLKAGVAGSYLDLIYMMGTNNSDAAITVDIRAVTAGNVQTSIRIPANGTAGVALPTAIPQDETGNNWTIDLPDVTGTTVTVSALFSKEI